MIIFNPLSSPVVYSDDGHILGGGERREVASLDKHGKRALAHGYIIILNEEDTEENAAATEEEEASGKEEEASGKGDISPARASRRGAKAKPKEEDSGASAQSESD